MRTYSLIERRSGNVVESFDSGIDAVAYILSEMGPTDEWALFEFGSTPTANRLLAADLELIRLASAVASRLSQPQAAPAALARPRLVVSLRPSSAAPASLHTIRTGPVLETASNLAVG